MQITWNQMYYLYTGPTFYIIPNNLKYVTHKIFYNAIKELLITNYNDAKIILFLT